MTDSTIELVQSSWEKVAMAAPEIGALFYATLFARHPHLVPLFKDNMGEQGKKLVQVLGMTVVMLKNREQLVPILESLGKRHVGYGVKDEDYGAVGETLIFCIEETLRSDFSPETKAGWTEVYEWISAVMITAANS